MTRHRRITCLVAVAASLVLTASIAHAIGVGYTVPVTGANYSPNSTVSYAGNYIYTNLDSTVTGVSVSTMTGSPDPTKGTSVSSNMARLFNVVNNPDGGGSGEFDSYNVSPALTAPGSGPASFYVTFLPGSATSLYYPNGPNNPPYYNSVTVNVTK
jgi:hypothetical protein